jgi:hypothetical protein
LLTQDDPSASCGLIYRQWQQRTDDDRGVTLEIQKTSSPVVVPAPRELTVDLTLTSEQEMLVKPPWLPRAATLADVRALEHAAHGFDCACWRESLIPAAGWRCRSILAAVG